jgi:hypothetical protein
MSGIDVAPSSDDVGTRPDRASPDHTSSPRARRWTGGRIAALVVGIALVLFALGPVGGGAFAVWVDRTQRDTAGYVTTGTHAFATSGSALVTDPVELDSPGVGWLYSAVILGNVRIQVTPTTASAPVFVGIAASDDVDRYLAGVDRTVISDVWTDGVESAGGGAPASVPGTQGFWVASATGTGTQAVTWDAANGTWTAVVMDPNGDPGVDVEATLGATMPALLGIAFASLLIGALFLLGGALLIIGSVHRAKGGRG